MRCLSAVDEIFAICLLAEDYLVNTTRNVRSIAERLRCRQ